MPNAKIGTEMNQFIAIADRVREAVLRFNSSAIKGLKKSLTSVVMEAYGKVCIHTIHFFLEKN